MKPQNGEFALGVLAPDVARTIVVISGDGELAVALRDRVDRAFAVVKDIRPPEVPAGLAACKPWPWMVIGNGTEASASDLDIALTRPVLLFWMGDMPDGLPGHARRFHRFTDLAGAVTGCLGHSVAGMRLSVGSGVVLPDGAHARSPELQALISSHPHELHLPLACFRSARRLLASRRIPCRPAGDRSRNAVSLRAAGRGRRP